MSDKFYRIPIDRLFKWILNEEKEGRNFGLYKEHFFTPNENDRFKMERYGVNLETPIGVAAGPHSQLAHNIIASWLCGARYIELKTVQTLDKIEVTKPCIDMEDEGYNCEWSQELKVHDSFDEYLNAWIILHILKHKFGWNDMNLGFIFNMSVGYDLKGILKPNVQWFFDKMNNCREEKERKLDAIEKHYPAVHLVKIPDRISDNITLSTMHGCPSDEIEKIGKYLIEERKLHIAIKLNPTLLGPDKLRFILNNKLGYDITVPDEAFEHDLQYNDAVNMINSLQQTANENGVDFGLKLTNTLESLNSTRWLPQKEKMVYTSGRALHPISINLAAKLQLDFDGKLDLSFSAGVDAFNITDTLACNLKPVTVCSDLLKPGGYLRLTQYLEEIEKSIRATSSSNINEFILSRSNGCSELNGATKKNLLNYTEATLENKYYHKNNFPYENIKTSRQLTEYDCIHAPCVESCAVQQNVPEYMYHTARGEYEQAYKVILQDNPLPNITGNVCDHLCQAKCTRINYDKPLLIRGIKRFIAEKFDGSLNLDFKNKNDLKVAIIGAGPSGLSCAYFLTLEGFEVSVYEGKPFAGGMVSDSIPTFRLTDKQIKNDFELIKTLGVNFYFDRKVDKELFNSLQDENDFIYIAVGAQKSKRLNIEGEDLDGVHDQLSFLSNIRRGEKLNVRGKIAIIGGGLSAVDAARAANRIKDKNGKVTMIYRRTQKEMPVGADELRAVLEEGIELLELTAPSKIEKYNNSQLSLTCHKMELGKKDESGRRRPIPISNSEFESHYDTIITAIGQEIDLDFVEEGILNIDPETNETQFEKIFAGGDALRSADSLINAMGDGKKVAERIIKKANANYKIPIQQERNKISPAEFQKKQAYREYGISLPELEVSERNNFDLVNPVLDEDAARKEAERCLFCEDVCNICVGVCPNFSNVTFEVGPIELPVWEIKNIGNSVQLEKVNTFKVRQGNQIFYIGDFCNECGNCDTFCPTSGAPYKTKPHFYLTEESFNSEEIGYFLNGNSISFKSDKGIEKLFLSNNLVIYESDEVIAKFIIKELKLSEVKIKSNTKESIKLEKAAEMYFLLMNLKDHSIFN